MNGSLLPGHVDTQLRSLERVGESDRDPITALRETVEAIWQVVEQAASEPGLDVSRHGARALLARRELLHRGTCILSAVIRGGVESGAFRPGCASWAIRRLPFAIVAGACAHWVFGLATAPSLRASAAVEAALEVLRPRCMWRSSRRKWATERKGHPVKHVAAAGGWRTEEVQSRAKLTTEVTTRDAASVPELVRRRRYSEKSGLRCG